MRRFSLYRRNSIYYARFWNEATGKYCSAKSTGETTKRGAEAVVAGWDRFGFDGTPQSVDRFMTIDTLLTTIRNTDFTSEETARIIEAMEQKGMIESASLPSSGTESQPLADFLDQFWDYESSPYVKEKLAYGQSIGRRHCYEQRSLSKHWRRFFGDEFRIKDLTREHVQQFQMDLKLNRIHGETVVRNAR